MKYSKFQILSIKAKMSMVQKRLIELGYNCSVTGRRDKSTVKGIQKVQKANGITENGVICQRTFDALFSSQ